MAVTSPDNIWTPDSGDEYALTVDLAAMADTVQDAILNRTSMVVADLDELVTATPTSPGKTAVVLSLGAMFRRNSADTTWVQITPAQVPTATRDVEYAKASGVFLVPLATNYNSTTGAWERYTGLAWRNTSPISYSIADLGTWTQVAATSGLFVREGWATLTLNTSRATTFAPGSTEDMASIPVAARPGGNVVVSAGAFTTSFPSQATVIIAPNGIVTMFNGSAVQQSIGFTASYPVA